MVFTTPATFRDLLTNIILVNMHGFSNLYIDSYLASYIITAMVGECNRTATWILTNNN